MNLRVRDRLTGAEVEISSDTPWVSGRYVALEPMKVNEHTRLAAGEPWVDDGSAQVVTDSGFSCRHMPPTADHDEEIALLRNSWATLAADTRPETPPLIPAALFDFKPETWEALLDEVLAEGHLHHIARYPRLDLHYEEQVTPVARARRLAPRVLSHLVAHSECWEKRTVDGVEPRKLLARFSEDDYGIYENRVFARLLDRLQARTQSRLARLNRLLAQGEQQEQLPDSAEAHRLRHRVCELWGHVFTGEAGAKKSAELKEQQTTLENRRKRIRTLQASDLYRRIPATSRVAEELSRTNILQHDSHYRYLPRLWVASSGEKSNRRPAEVMAANRKALHHYARYIQRVAHHALARYRQDTEMHTSPANWAGRSLCLEITSDDVVVIRLGPEPVLRLVPMLDTGVPPADLPRLSPETRYVWAPLDDIPTASATWPVDSAALPLTPFDLRVVERLGHELDQRLLEMTLGHYGDPIGPFPSGWVEKLLAQTPASTPRSESLAWARCADKPNYVICLRPCPTAQLDELLKMAPILREPLLRQQALLHSWFAAPADTIENDTVSVRSDANGFKATKGDLTWRFSRSDGLYRRTCADKSDFAGCGRDALIVKLHLSHPAAPVPTGASSSPRR